MENCVSIHSESLEKTEDESDKNCVTSCGLKYGLSEVFNQNVLAQQKIKIFKSKLKVKTFDDPKDQSYYCHMLKDVMVKTFTTEDEQKIFRKALEGMRANYPEIFDGLEKNMFYCPSSFHLSARIGEDESCIPDALDEMKASLESEQHLSSKDERNLKQIRSHLQKLRPELAEQEFVDTLASFFYNQRGIFIHSLKLNDHLKVLTNKAREYRRQNKNIGFKLTEFETKLKELLNISSQVLDDTADAVVNHLLRKPKARNTSTINGKVIRESIDEQLRGNDRMYVMKLFKPAKFYTINEVRDGVALGKFESECHVAGENDLFIMLPDSKLILCIEIKRHMTSNVANSTSVQPPNIDKNMFSASSQLKKNANFISSKNGAILSTDWRFAKICAISPSIYSPDKICENCKKFILTTDILKTPEGLEKWWKETGLSKRAEMFDIKSKKEAYSEFQLFFNRMVCMSSVRIVPDPFHTWAQVQGSKHHHNMSAGHTLATQGIHTEAIADDLEFDEILRSSHHAFKTLFFAKSQMALLSTNNFPFAIFLCDFGAGKSLICKEKCIQTIETEQIAKDNDLNYNVMPVFFISLVGVDEFGRVEEHEYIFDIFTKEYDFQNIDVKVLSAQDLWKFYQSKNEGADREHTDIYMLVEYFVRFHPNSHFVLDECPFIKKYIAYSKYDATSVKRLAELLKRCRQQLKSESNLFWISLQSNLLADLSHVTLDFANAIQDFKAEMKTDRWLLPSLHANMRNQKNIANIQVQKGAYAGEMQNLIEKLQSGSSLLGEVPILFKVRVYDWNIKKNDIIKNCFDLMNKKSTKNVVVLWDEDYLLKNVADDIKSVIQDKKVVVYPSKQSKKETISNVKYFVEKNGLILVAKNIYVNGCEFPNVIYINWGYEGVRNSVLRGVENILVVQLVSDYDANFSGIKEDNRYFEAKIIKTSRERKAWINEY